MGRSLCFILFCDACGEADGAAIRPGATSFVLDNGRIIVKKPILGIWRLFTVEGATWALPSPLLPQIPGLCALQPKDGPNGRLEGIGWFQQRTSVPGVAEVPPRIGAWYANPMRDYVIEQMATVSYSKDVSLDDAVADLAAPSLTNPAIAGVESAAVTEYAQTPSGRWYARTITQSRSGVGTTNVTRVFLDTAREFPDDLFDPAKFESEHKSAAK